MPVPVGPGVLYPQPEEVSGGSRGYPWSYDSAAGAVPTPVVSTDPNGRFAAGENPSAGGTVPFNVAPEKQMREPGGYGEV